MKQQVSNINPAYIAEWPNVEITFTVIANLQRYGYPSKVTNGKVAIQHTVP